MKISVCIGYVVKGEPMNLPDGEYELVSAGSATKQEQRIKFLEAELAGMADELEEWRALKDPVVLHVNLLRGFPARLTHDQLAHLIGSDHTEHDLGR